MTNTQTWDGVTERRKGIVEQGGTLQARLDALNNNVERLTNVVDENTKALSRLAVLEVNHSNSDKAIDRAFKAIIKNQEELEEFISKQSDSNGKYDRWIYTVSGFVVAITAFWSVAGYRINAVIDDQMKAVTEMRMHIHDDKITNPEQVRSLTQKQ